MQGRQNAVTQKNKTMKTKNIICSLLTAGLLVAVVAGCATEQQKQAKLAAQAKISRAVAEQTALARVPGGTIKEGELEKEGGKLVWSFDITTTGSKDITEILVDAKTGAIVSEEKESPEQQAKEKKQDGNK